MSMLLFGYSSPLAISDGIADTTIIKTNYIDDVFCLYAYTGTGAQRELSPGFNCANGKTMTLLKCRTNTGDHYISDNVRGYNKTITYNVPATGSLIVNYRVAGASTAQVLTGSGSYVIPAGAKNVSLVGKGAKANGSSGNVLPGNPTTATLDGVNYTFPGGTDLSGTQTNNPGQPYIAPYYTQANSVWLEGEFIDQDLNTMKIVPTIIDKVNGNWPAKVTLPVTVQYENSQDINYTTEIEFRYNTTGENGIMVYKATNYADFYANSSTPITPQLNPGQPYIAPYIVYSGDAPIETKNVTLKPNTGLLFNTNNTSAQIGPIANSIVNMTETGVIVGSHSEFNTLARKYIAAIFKERERFFSIVDYVGDGTALQVIQHALACSPGMIWIKRLDAIGSTIVRHSHASGELTLDGTGTPAAGGYTNITNYSEATVTVAGTCNVNNGRYLMMLFANDSAEDSIIKTGIHNTGKTRVTNELSGTGTIVIPAGVTQIRLVGRGSPGSITQMPGQAYVPAKSQVGSVAYPNGLPPYIGETVGQGVPEYPSGLPAYGGTVISGSLTLDPNLDTHSTGSSSFTSDTPATITYGSIPPSITLTYNHQGNNKSVTLFKTTDNSGTGGNVVYLGNVSGGGGTVTRTYKGNTLSISEVGNKEFPEGLPNYIASGSRTPPVFKVKDQWREAQSRGISGSNMGSLIDNTPFIMTVNGVLPNTIQYTNFTTGVTYNFVNKIESADSVIYQNGTYLQESNTYNHSYFISFDKYENFEYWPPHKIQSNSYVRSTGPGWNYHSTVTITNGSPHFSDDNAFLFTLPRRRADQQIDYDISRPTPAVGQEDYYRLFMDEKTSGIAAGSLDEVTQANIKDYFVLRAHIWKFERPGTIQGDPLYPSGLLPYQPATPEVPYIAPYNITNTGNSFTVHVNSSLYAGGYNASFPAGVGGPATITTHTVNLVGSAAMTINYNIPSGAALTVEYDSITVGNDIPEEILVTVNLASVGFGTQQTYTIPAGATSIRFKGRGASYGDQYNGLNTEVSITNPGVQSHTFAASNSPGSPIPAETTWEVTGTDVLQSHVVTYTCNGTLSLSYTKLNPAAVNVISLPSAAESNGTIFIPAGVTEIMLYGEGSSTQPSTISFNTNDGTELTRTFAAGIEGDTETILLAGVGYTVPYVTPTGSTITLSYNQPIEVGYGTFIRSVTGSGTVTVPAGVASLKITGKGGPGSRIMTSPGQPYLPATLGSPEVPYNPGQPYIAPTTYQAQIGLPGYPQGLPPYQTNVPAQGNPAYPSGLPAYQPAVAGQGNPTWPDGLLPYIEPSGGQGDPRFPNGLLPYKVYRPQYGLPQYPDGLPPYQDYILESGNVNYPSGLPPYQAEVLPQGNPDYPSGLPAYVPATSGGQPYRTGTASYYGYSGGYPGASYHPDTYSITFQIDVDENGSIINSVVSPTIIFLDEEIGGLVENFPSEYGGVSGSSTGTLSFDFMASHNGVILTYRGTAGPLQGQYVGSPQVGLPQYPSGLPPYVAGSPQVGNPSFPSGLPPYQPFVPEVGEYRYPDGLPDYRPEVLAQGDINFPLGFPPYDPGSGGQGDPGYPDGFPPYVPASPQVGLPQYPSGLPPYVPAQSTVGNVNYPQGLPAYVPERPASPGQAYIAPTPYQPAVPASAGQPYIAPTYQDTVGQNTTATINGVSKTFEGGTGGDAIIKVENVVYPGALGDTITYSVAPGGSLELSSGVAEPAYVITDFEPQYLLIKNISTGGNWVEVDCVRGLTEVGSPQLSLNTSAPETPGLYAVVNAKGFKLVFTGANELNESYIYMAIARSNKPPISGNNIFSAYNHTGSGSFTDVTFGFSPDLVMSSNRVTGKPSSVVTRLTDGSKVIDLTAQAGQRIVTAGSEMLLDSFTGVRIGNEVDGQASPMNNNILGQQFVLSALKRASKVMDVMIYKGTSVINAQKHNLKATPQLWLNKNISNNDPWKWGSIYMSPNEVFKDSEGLVVDTNIWGGAYPSSSLFNVGVSSLSNNYNDYYMTILWGSLQGVQKVFSYTGNGDSGGQLINCDFANGARAIIIIRLDVAAGPFMWDYARGITAGNDPHFVLHSTAGASNVVDTIGLDTTGFIVKQNLLNMNASGGRYIGLAIA